MPNLTLDANKIVYILLTIIVFLCGSIITSWIANTQNIATKQDEITAQLQKINLRLVEISKDMLTRSDVIEIVNDELIKNGLKTYGH